MQTQKVQGVATIIRNEEDYIVCQYHLTDVVRFNSKCIILNSGNWRTMTTKLRMNQVSNQYGLGFHVFQKGFVWFVNYKGKTLNFTDYMELKR